MHNNNRRLDQVKAIAREWWPTPERTPAPPPTVLIVDDEEAILGFVQRVLHDAGCRTVVARNGEEAVTVASKTDGLDLLVTDLMMPNMNGDELARRLRATMPDLGVLYLTGFSDRLFEERAQLWQDEAFLDKPCSIKGLLEAVSMVSHRTMARGGDVPGDVTAASGPWDTVALGES
jgi:CheY-like chemotaxis protein